MQRVIKCNLDQTNSTLHLVHIKHYFSVIAYANEARHNEMMSQTKWSPNSVEFVAETCRSTISTMYNTHGRHPANVPYDFVTWERIDTARVKYVTCFMAQKYQIRKFTMFIKKISTYIYTVICICLPAVYIQMSDIGNVLKKLMGIIP